MFRFFKKNFYDSESVTIIGQGMKIDANLLNGCGVVRVEGQYEGGINIDGDLILEKSGCIFGNVKVKVAYISGSITGNVKCSELLHITSTGKITGDIESKEVLMDAGAVFIGYSKMTERIVDPLGLEE